MNIIGVVKAATFLAIGSGLISASAITLAQAPALRLADIPEADWRILPGDILRARLAEGGTCDALKQEAERGSARAQSLYGGAVSQKICGNFDPDLAITLGRKAAAAGDRRGVLVEVVGLRAKGDHFAANAITERPELRDDATMIAQRADAAYFGYGRIASVADAAPLYRAAAAKGEYRSLLMLAWIAHLGSERAADKQLAENYLRRAASTGWAEGVALYGNFLVEGRLGESRKSEGIPFLRQAATQGSSAGEIGLARALVSGAGGEKNPGQGINMLLALSEKGNSEADYVLGQFYRGEGGFDRQRDRAIFFLKKAAGQEHAAAWRSLHQEYMRPEATQDERDMRFIALERASDLGDSDAANDLGIQWENGTMNWKSPQKALYFYEKAAKKGNAAGAYNVGRFYQYGIEVPRDIVVAERYYNQAAGNGYQLAKTALAEMKSPAAPARQVAANASTQASTSALARPNAQGAPTARQIRDALVYEQTYGRVTVADAMGIGTRHADYDAGISRTTFFGITVVQSYDVANPSCILAEKGKFTCRYDLKLVAAGFPYNGPGSHTFEMQGGRWRSPTYLKAIVDAGNRSAAGANNGRNCTVQGFGTAEGASLKDQNGLSC